MQAILREVLEGRLAKEEYSNTQSPIIAEELLKSIRERIAERLKMPRYKLCF